ncbi:universal bacterial protein YeaZ [Halobacteroides halobius DSM 5150]|uniref:Universal bacterial protein YeaZ n=1 Tax=Halobacteroides halobius (strain ATCC 35273 / DSM 5150 / MD-1) TaxID=748449 RepID=L0K5N7_HALHC|nr:tRNA (adenosine(37)-N6)-threonylcarbamoyltransferase complex dimerization subunit type 1 TsaB [Halobacteroides halobius]AGB40306.1 universal bacterial protein YeaZ [Halobacteroides halobius DSM 5150]
MLVLGIDSSTNVGSVSLIAEDRLIGEHLLNLEETHSQRLMPQIINLIESCNYQVQDLDGIGVALGPGSFTGTRIGVATAKSLAQSLEVSIVGVSTLEAIAFSLRYISGYICPMIDARGGRIFTSLYQSDKQLKMVRKETILQIDDLITELTEVKGPIYFVGQVAKQYQEKINDQIEQAEFVRTIFNLPRAGAISEIAFNRLQQGAEDELFALTPNYLKRSQAEIQWDKKHG